MIAKYRFQVSGVRCQVSVSNISFPSYETSLEDFVGFGKNSEFVMPVPDQVRDDGSGIQNKLELLDSGLRRKDALKKFWLFTTSSSFFLYQTGRFCGQRPC
jgi:hypothetical protein